jgi:hypothetical protein
MRVLRRDRVRCLIREYDQLTCSDTVSGAHRTSYGTIKAHIVLWNGLQVRPRGMGEKKAQALSSKPNCDRSGPEHRRTSRRKRELDRYRHITYPRYLRRLVTG